MTYRPMFANPNNAISVWNEPDELQDDEDEIFVPFGDSESDEISLDIESDVVEHVLSEILDLHGVGMLVKLMCEMASARDLDKRIIPMNAMVKAITAYKTRAPARIPGNRAGVWIRFKKTPSARPRVFQAPIQQAPTRVNTFSVSTPSVSQASVSQASKTKANPLSSHPFFFHPPKYKPSWA